ncbi:hypothetical protein NECAME_15799 [Necator americanus]|uniref:Uncharacterized protein n=1 Tax=Necator americanus TaxID=51031 RepID=W2SHX0_NECAM|nr:hypothetical protein NECAME_15799 [Necator americanus]ETN68471.1 hypothetical protein NECAME_15799 [Necator americanus]
MKQDAPQRPCHNAILCGFYICRCRWQFVIEFQFKAEVTHAKSLAFTSKQNEMQHATVCEIG